MASPKNKAVEVAGNFVFSQAKRLAADPEVHKAILLGAAPAAAAAKKAAAKVKVPHRADPFDKLEAGLDAVSEQLASLTPEDSNPETVANWHRRLKQLRTAVPLAKADAGKGRRQKLADLSKRQHDLLNEVYDATVG